MQFKTKLKSATEIIDLTPLVDVIFLLLIFFIVTSDILPLKSLNIENPTLNSDSAPLTTQLVIVVDSQSVIYLGSKKAIVDLGSLKEALDEEIKVFKTAFAQRAPTIVLSVDRRVSYEIFLRLFAIVQQFGTPLRLVYKPLEPHEYL